MPSASSASDTGSRCEAKAVDQRFHRGEIQFLILDRLPNQEINVQVVQRREFHPEFTRINKPLRSLDQMADSFAHQTLVVDNLGEGLDRILVARRDVGVPRMPSIVASTGTKYPSGG